MAQHQSDPLFLHPILHAALPGMLSAIKDELPNNWTPKTGGNAIHRTPNEQLEVYKKGRKFINGTWKVVEPKKVVTYKDGFKSLSRHNYLGATAVDIVLIQPNGVELAAGPQEQKIKAGSLKYGFEWGGDFKGNFKDLPHIQIPLHRLFKNSLLLDQNLQWQKFLFHGGALTKPEQLDGLWGKISIDALESLINLRERTPAAWEMLYERYGPIEDMDDFEDFDWIPKIK